MTSLCLLLTQNCNLKCSYCYEHEKDKSVMSFETAKKSIDNIRPNNIVFFGGEPLLQQELILQIIDYEKSNPVEYSIITNATLINKSFLDRLNERNTRIGWCVSLDGNAEVNNLTRDRFDLVWEGVQTLIAHGIDTINIRATITPKNLEYLSSTYQFFIDNGLTNVQFQWVTGETFSKEDFTLFQKECQKVRDIYVSNKDKIKKLAFGHFNRNTKFCGYGSHYLVLRT